MATMTLAVFAALLGVLPQGAWKHEVEGFPHEAFEGQPLIFRIRYSAPEPVLLHVELKDRENVVHSSLVRQVSGTGTLPVQIPVPEGVFRGSLMVAVWMGEDWRQPRADIVHTEAIPVYTAAEFQRQKSLEKRAADIRKRLGLSPQRPAVVVLSGGWAGRSKELAEAYRAEMEKAGLRSVIVGPWEITTPGVLDPRWIRLFVIPEAQVFPGEAILPLDRYLRRGGNLLALGGPAMDRLVTSVTVSGRTEWLDEKALTARLERVAASTPLLDMSRLKPEDWKREANDLSSPSAWRMEAPGNGVGPAVRHEIGQLSGWDTIGAPLDRAAAPGENLVFFRARGEGATTALAVELRERDGSRWIATVPLSQTWRRYALPPSDFRLWDPERSSGRGGKGDQVNLQAVERVVVGLAFTHTSVPGGKHAYWFADLETGKGPDVVRYNPPVLETISPDYKLYPIREAVSVRNVAGQALVNAPTPPLPRNLLSTHPRPTGSGFLKERSYRWIPLLQVEGKNGTAGTLATLIRHLSGPYAGGAWASFTAPDREWYARPDVRRYVIATVRRMLGRPMFAEAGAQYFGYFPDEKPLLGARVPVHDGKGLSVRFTVTDGKRSRAFQRTVPFQRTGSDAVAQVRWQPDRLTEHEYTVVAELLEGNTVLDRLEHPITVRHPVGYPGTPRPRTWIGIRNGQFELDGKPWYPHGVNYMPSSGIATEAGSYFEYWLSSQSYDPVVIDRDLRRIRDIGFNMVSVFIYTHTMHSHNLVDLLNRCDRYGLRVNLSLRPGTPLDFEWPGVGDIIKVNRLADDPTVFAYDLAWEPMWLYRNQRKRWDGAWEEWLRRQYGSVEAAERDLGEAIPREDGRVAGPSDADVGPNSRIPRVAAAYRRFQDDLLSRKHMEARQKIRTVDTKHLLSFRMTLAGDPTAGPAIMPYDFAGLARSMDFMAPEGYGRIGDWERVKPGWFTAAYSRMTAPGRPVLWAEFGYTIWNKGSQPDIPQGASFADAFDARHYVKGTIEFTERYYRDFFEMALRSGSAGTVCWWYPGGYRVGENSDFGIINPDGTWRGITRIIREYADRFAQRPFPPEPDVWLTVDRDRHPDGIYGIYTEVGQEFWRLIDEGRFPGLKTEAHGSDSATCPLIAVGNVPYTGENPLKYLNGEFEHVRVLDRDGTWVDVPYEGATVQVRSGEPVRLRVLAGNNGVALWKGGTAEGCVGVLVRGAGVRVEAMLPSDVPPLGTADEIELTLPPQEGTLDVQVTLLVRGRGRFGEVRPIRISAG